MKVIISGGGTGGHVFPAIAIAKALEKAKPGVELLFVGALGRMEMEKVPAAGYSIVGLKISGFRRSLSLKNLAFPFKVLAALRQAKKIIRDFQPDVAVGVGGYASGPVLRVASKSKIPCVLQEQNSFPGVTNKILAAKASKICVAYEGMEKFFPAEKIIFTGNPVRSDMVELDGKHGQAMEAFQLQEEKKVLLVLGGSLGALTINESIKGSLRKLCDAGLQIIWQTGKNYIENAREAVKEAGLGSSVHPTDFISRMDLAYAAADLIVSRAGAISISELCLVGKPLILVPSPNVAEDHQTKNAMALVNVNAALMVKDTEAREKLANEILRLSENQDLKNEMKNRILTMGRMDAADAIAEVIIKLVE